MTIGNETLPLAPGHALRVRADRIGALRVDEGLILLASIHPLG